MSVLQNGVPIRTLRSRTSYWLLALLALRLGHEVSRDWLAATLWPESAPELALYNLRRCLSDVKDALGSEAALVEAPSRRTLRLASQGTEVDVARFAEFVQRGCEGDLERAVILHAAPLLEGCPEEWAIPERVACEQALLGALDRLAALARERGDTGGEVRWLRRCVAADPLREECQRALMEALAARGDIAGVRMVYDTLRRVLRSELNLAPSRETETLYSRLLQQAASPSALASPMAQARPLTRRLPAPLTPLIGREQDVETLVKWLRVDRLVTLTGTGGVGKTRLSISVAEAAEGRFEDGVWFVELAAITDPALVTQTVAEALGIREQSDCAPRQVLQQALRHRDLLLVLDNCEHLLDSCALLTHNLLEHCPAVRILVTSRQPLAITGERTYRVPSLSLPTNCDSSPDRSLASLLSHSAVELFVERASRVRAGFQLTNQNAAVVCTICRLLDGIPLALELAAARTRTDSVGEIAENLHDRFRILIHGSRTALARQQTLRALVDWSYDLLQRDEQAILERASVFAGGWTTEAAETVCSDESLEPARVREILVGLVDRSLVVVEERDGRARFRMLETIRLYASERLQEVGQLGAVRARHREYFVRLAEEAAPHVEGPDEVRWLARLDEEHDNFRAALSGSVPGSCGATSLRLCCALNRYWIIRGHWREGFASVEAALCEPDSFCHPQRSKGLRAAGSLAVYLGEYATAQARFAAALKVARERRSDDDAALALQSMGYLARTRGDYDASRRALDESRKLLTEIGEARLAASASLQLGYLEFDQGRDQEAQDHYARALACFQDAGERRGVANTLIAMGSVARNRGDLAAARRLYCEGLEIFEETGDPRGVAWSLVPLGYVDVAEKKGVVAQRNLRDGLRLFARLGDRDGIAYALEGLAAAAALCGQVTRACHLWGAAEALREAVGAPLPLNERASCGRRIAAARAVADLDEFDEAWREGRGLALEHAIDLALNLETEELTEPDTGPAVESQP